MKIKLKNKGQIQKEQNGKAIRSVGRKPYDFHMLKYSTSYSGFPKIKSVGNIGGDEININFAEEVKQREKISTFLKVKNRSGIDKWRQKYRQQTQICYTRNKVEENIPLISQNISQQKMNLVKKNPEPINNVKIDILFRFSERKKTDTKVMEPQDSIIRGSSFGIKKIKVGEKSKPRLRIAKGKYSSETRFDKEGLERWEVDEDDNQFIQS